MTVAEFAAYSECLLGEEFIPAEWMEGVVIPLHKGAASSRDIGNYRKITSNNAKNNKKCNE